MKKILNLFLLMSIGVLTAQNLTPKEFINVAGKQRMLSQKITKNFLIKTYSELDQGYKMSPKVESDYKIAKSLFKRNLELLFKNTNLNSNKEVYSLLNDEKEAWKNLSDFLEEEKSAKNAMKIVKLSNKLLVKSNAVVLAAQKNFSTSNTDPALLELINKSGKQRMLSQRLCMLYTAKKIQNYLPEKEKKNNFAIDKVLEDMDIVIGDLMISDYNHKAHSEDKVGEVSLEFDNLKEKRNVFVKGNLDVNTVFSTTNNLTKLFNDLTMAYTKV